MQHIDAMHFLELKAKVKSGKENELNQVLKDLVPQFKSIPNLKTQVDFNEDDGVLNLKLSNGENSEKVKQIMDSRNFVLFIGSLKVLCDKYTLTLPGNSEKKQSEEKLKK